MFKSIKINIRNFNQPSKANTTLANHRTTLSREWLAAKPYESLPGPSKYQLVAGFLPGGKFYKKSFIDFNRLLRSQYGEIFLLPGLYGKRDVVFSYNPNDYQQVFRTEGIYPIRRGFDIIHYHREEVRKEMFKHAVGLVAAQGKSWSKFRSAVNHIMMNPKTIRMYIPKMDQVAQKLVECVKRLRDPQTLEVPENFETYLKYCTMDAVGLVALDTDLNMLENSQANPKAKILINRMDEFFQLLLELDFQPSMWKIIPTPKLRKVIKVLDTLNEIAFGYVQEAKERLKQNNSQTMKMEESILERLIKIDPLIATTMSTDIFLAGADATTSALAGCLLCLAKNPSKQTLLRQELVSALPQKHSELNKENMENLPYLRACIKESLRLYPITTGNFRTTGQDVVLSGYRISANTDISMTAQLLLRDSKYFAHPDMFLPERWLRSNVSEPNADIGSATKGNPFVYLPFGFGPRICIGKRIVDLELEAVLSRLIRNFEIQFDYPTDNMFKSNIINVPAKPLQFKFTDINY